MAWITYVADASSRTQRCYWIAYVYEWYDEDSCRGNKVDNLKNEFRY